MLSHESQVSLIQAHRFINSAMVCVERIASNERQATFAARPCADQADLEALTDALCELKQAMRDLASIAENAKPSFRQ